MTGLETSELLVSKGNKVTVVEMAEINIKIILDLNAYFIKLLP